MIKEQRSCIIGNVAIRTTLHRAPNDIGAFTDTDELRILMESTRSHGYFCQPQLEDWEYLTLRLDSYPVRHFIGRPGIKTMLVLADTLRLIGLSTPPRALTSNASTSTTTNGISSIQTPTST